MFWDSDSILCQGGLHLSLAYFAMFFLTVSSMRTDYLSFWLCPAWCCTGQAAGSKIRWLVVGMEGPMRARSGQKPSERGAEAWQGLAEQAVRCAQRPRGSLLNRAALSPGTALHGGWWVRREKKRQLVIHARENSTQVPKDINER